MPECDFCGEEFDSEHELHLHWGDKHRDEINTHQKEKLKKAERKKKEREEAKMRRRKKLAGWSLAATAALAVIGLLSIQLLSTGGGSQKADFRLDQQPMLGNESAPVTVVEFGDFYCPACQSWNFRVKPRLKENYIQTGQAKLYWIDFPLSIHEPQASAAARAAECVYRQDKQQFWSYNQALFQNQRSFDYSTEGFMDIANRSTSGLDYQQLRQCISSQETSQAVQQDQRIARKNSVTSTPTIYVNGEKVGNSYTEIEAAIERNLP